ncbi:hypothetical protein [Phaeobacter gallaeciensis]|uniref:hypothetical protein n=1 Tax=Phaeobacter gallaeciensis TaxID=60890 RepID=UPI00237F9470|nr:hypothetical protein [Phaeobacter gallaeciensis]MDE4059780.1 hypothetical protein [Phaeobacter gallaeciensis]MDE4122583.1 hypothetical protein [Phaeobacter gallaeciensis]MDE4127268.1 hypothetical protein [Phaeobacter gallaeciensis]
MDVAKAECRRRILSVVDETAQINLAAAAGANRLTAEQRAAYVAGLDWIMQMRAAWPSLAASGADLSDDASWPAVPAAAADLAGDF